MSAWVSPEDASAEAPPPWDWSLRVQVRWSDLDALGHVHHLAYLRWCEDVRNEHALAVGLPAPGTGACSQVILRLDVHYLRPAPRDAELQMRMRVLRLGRTSAEVLCRLEGPAQALFEARVTTVLCDDRTHRPVPWPDAVRQRIEAAPPPAAAPKH